MSSDLPDRAVAVHLKEKEGGATLGVALFVPSVRYAATLIDGAGGVRERPLPLSVWREIDSWVAAGDSGLPAEPAPLSPTVVTALLEREQPSISGHRFASFPMQVQERAALDSTVKRLLPRLVSAA